MIRKRDGLILQNWDVPVDIPSLPNLRLHWAKRARLTKAQRDAVAMFVRGLVIAPPCTVLLVRVSSRKIRDDDNLIASFKAVRDQMASLLRVDDSDPDVRWVCRQATFAQVGHGKGTQPYVRIALMQDHPEIPGDDEVALSIKGT